MTEEERHVKHIACCKLRHAAHREEDSAKYKIYRVAHREELRVRAIAYRAAHLEQERERSTCWALENPDKYKRWNLEHPEQLNELRIRWRLEHPEQNAAYAKKHNAKHRTLGFSPLNSPFPGCDGHHISQNEVVYIPHALHRSVDHNIWTGKGMQQINGLALQWLETAKVTE